MRILIVTLILSTSGLEATAQRAEKDVRAVIDRLFDGMRAGDGAIVRSAFHEAAVMARAVTNGDSTRLRSGTIGRFVEAVGQPHDEVWDERIWDVDIRVDGALASAWMQYAFYLGDELHHCGVNSMQLFRAHEGWKIVHLLDTDRGLDCRWTENEASPVAE